MKSRVLTITGRDTGATFTVEDEGRAQLHVIYDSRGTTAGTHAYRDGLKLLLQRLGEMGAIVHWIAIDTKATGHLSLEERTLRLPHAYPLDMGAIISTDGSLAEALRKQVHTAAARAGRAPGASGGGNGTKRLRLCVDLNAADVLRAMLSTGALLPWKQAS